MLRRDARSSRGRGRGGTGDFERKASWIRHVAPALSHVAAEAQWLVEHVRTDLDAPRRRFESRSAQRGLFDFFSVADR